MSYTGSGFDKRVRNLLALFQSVAPPPPPPPAPPVGMMLWLDSDSIPGADGAPVATWPDTSGNGFDAVAAGVTPPLKVSSAINGQAGVSFDGALASILALPTGFDDFSAGVEVFAVCRGVSQFADFCPIISFYNNAITSGFDFGYEDGQTGWYAFILQAPNAFIAPPAGTFTSGQSALISYRADFVNDASQLLKNGVVIGASTAPTLAVTPRNTNRVGFSAAGGYAPFTGVISEIVVYNRVLSAAERVEMAAYLFDKFAL